MYVYAYVRSCPTTSSRNSGEGKKIRSPCLHQALRISGATPTGCARAPPVESCSSWPTKGIYPAVRSPGEGKGGSNKDKKDSKHLATPATPNLGGYTQWVRSRAPTGMLVPPAEGVQPTKAADWGKASRIKLKDLAEIRKIRSTKLHLLLRISGATRAPTGGAGRPAKGV